MTDAPLYGYAGKVLRINLTDCTTETVDITPYLPKYIGGRMLADRLWWDEVKQAVGALDPANKLIFMTGPCAATGLPISGRAVITGVSAKNIPEQYTHSSLGGYFGSMLKWAGYDGFILEGKAREHTYVFIKDSKVQFLNADELWGKYVIDTQQLIMQKHGRDACALVIGPAGENLHRCASIVTHADNAAAKTGFGAVMGSKNLKAIAVVGTGSVQPADVQEVLRLRTFVGHPAGAPRPLARRDVFNFPWGRGKESIPEGYCSGTIACNPGCNRNCMDVKFQISDPLCPGEKVAMVGKCLDPVTAIRTHDSHAVIGASIHSRRQQKNGDYNWMCATNVDPDDPQLPLTLEKYPGDRINVCKNGMVYRNYVNWLCNQYGLDKWDITIWYQSWLSMCQQEGLLDELDFGAEVDVSDLTFIRKFIDDMVYRRTPLGDLFAEGMGRAIRKLGMEKYGKTIFHGRFNDLTGEPLDIPVSIETAWGESSHWLGRGFQGCHKYLWVSYSLTNMIGSRDEVCGQHFHDWVENWQQYKDDPCHSPLLIHNTKLNNQLNELKDSLLLCEYSSPNPGWPDMETQMYAAAAGVKLTTDELYEQAEIGRLLERAIFIRNHDRVRDLEVEQTYPFMTYPDPFGDTVTWDEWNDAVDLYYDDCGWDRRTGWPYRETWEKYGLKDVADELEKLGRLPDRNAPYTRKANPFDR